MEEEKPNQKEKPAFRDERITKLIPEDCSQRAGNGFCGQGVGVLQPPFAAEQGSREISHTSRARSAHLSG